jgi:hypothetical protein
MSRFSALFFYLSCIPTVWGQTSAAQPSSPQAGPSRVIECNTLMFRFLPGEYNYCLGRKLWELGKYERAEEMLKLAAGWGSKPAQGVLGVVYFNGEGVAENRPLGLAWLALAAERGTLMQRAIYDSASQKSTDDERREAAGLLEVMKHRYGDGVAAVRADRRYRREMSSFRSNHVYGSGTCLSGVNSPWGPMAPAAAEAGAEVLPVSGCSLASEERIVRGLEKRYEHFFEGWKGKITVGDVEQVMP